MTEPTVADAPPARPRRLRRTIFFVLLTVSLVVLAWQLHELYLAPKEPATPVRTHGFGAVGPLTEPSSRATSKPMNLLDFQEELAGTGLVPMSRDPAGAPVLSGAKRLYAFSRDAHGLAQEQAAYLWPGTLEQAVTQMRGLLRQRNIEVVSESTVPSGRRTLRWRGEGFSATAAMRIEVGSTDMVRIVITVSRAD